MKKGQEEGGKRKMTGTRKSFTSMTNEEIMSELEKTDSLCREHKRLKSQLKLYSNIDGLILWTRDRVELRGEEAIRYLKRRLETLERELAK